MKLIGCNFYASSAYPAQVLQTHGKNTNPVTTQVVIKNTNFTHNDTNKIQYFDQNINTSFISLLHTTLLLMNSVVFCNIYTPNSIISLEGYSIITISGTVQFSHNHVHDLINFNNYIKYIIIKENSIINISHNKVWFLFVSKPIATKYPYPFCLSQYFSNSASEVTLENRNFLISFYNNHCKQVLTSGCYDYMPNTNCNWLPQSIFNNVIPLEVNNHYMQFINDSGIYKLSQVIEQRSLCVCSNELQYDCHVHYLGYTYPGETLTVTFHHHKIESNHNTVSIVSVKTDNQQQITPCIVLNVSEYMQPLDKHCTGLFYTIGFPTENYCELFLKMATDSDDYLNIFYIRQITCPTGFAKIDKKCQCDPVLVHNRITNCNINDQTILRPANSWISATTNNDSYTYRISLHCPFYYCLHHSSHLNFSTPKTQCQFNKSGPIVNKVSVLSLVLFNANNAPLSTYSSLYPLE